MYGSIKRIREGGSLNWIKATAFIWLVFFVLFFIVDKYHIFGRGFQSQKYPQLKIGRQLYEKYRVIDSCVFQKSERELPFLGKNFQDLPDTQHITYYYSLYDLRKKVHIWVYKKDDSTYVPHILAINCKK